MMQQQLVGGRSLALQLAFIAMAFFGLAETARAASVSPPSGMIAWWSGDATGADWANGNKAVLTNGATLGTGKVGGAITLDGVNDHAVVPDSPLWALDTNAFTIELWANFSTASGNRAFVAYDTGTGAVNKWIFWRNSGQLQLHINGTGGALNIGSATFTPVVSQWYHLALTRQSSNFIFYVDGVAVSTNTSTRALPDATGPLTIGSAENSYYFPGSLDEVSIYSRALAAAEIQAIVAAGVDGKNPQQLPPLALIQGTPTNRIFLNTTITYTAMPVNPATNVTYQWFRNGSLLTNETNLTLALPSQTNAGTFAYAIEAANGNDTNLSPVATLIVSPLPGRLLAPIAQWHFDEAPGTTNAFDSGTNNFHGALSPTGAAFTNDARAGNAIAINGSASGYVTMSNVLGLTGSDFSLAFWMKSTNSNASRVVGKHNAGTANGYLLQMGATTGYGAANKVSLYTSTIASTGRDPRSITSINDGEWHQVVALHRGDGSLNRIYVDGAPFESSTAADVVAGNAAPFLVGGSYSAGTIFGSFIGVIDELQVFDRLLGDDQVDFLFTQPDAAAVSEADLPAGVYYWADPVGGNWNDPSRWIPTGVPGSGDTAYINVPGTYIVTNNTTRTVSQVFLGVDSGTNFIGTPTLAQLGGTFTITNLTVATNGVVTMSSALTVVNSLACAGQVNQTAAALRLSGAATINLYNLSGGEQRGGTLTVTNLNWTDGNLNADANGDKVIIPSGGVLNLLGSASRFLSYNSPATYGRGLDNYGTWNWSSNSTLYGLQNGCVVNNHGTVNVTSGTGNPQFAYYPGYSSPYWNNYGTFNKSAGSGIFYFNNVYLNNHSLLTASAGTFSIYNTTFTNYANVSVGAAAICINESSTISTFTSGSSLTCAAVDSFQIPGGTVYFQTTNITTPTVLINGGTLHQQAANVVDTINQTSGAWRLAVTTEVNTYNLSGGQLRGGTLTVTNLNWTDGNLNADTNGDKTIIPPGGVLNLLGSASRFLSYNSPATYGRGLDNYGTWNWSSNSTLYGLQNGCVVNNHGTVNVTSGTGNPQFAYYPGYSSPYWNNYGTFNKSAGSGIFYFNNVYLNNHSLLTASAGTFSIYNTTFTNYASVSVTGDQLQVYGTTGTNLASIAVGPATLFTVESSSLGFGPVSSLNVPGFNNARLVSGSVFLDTTNVSTPSLWISGATLYQHTNIVVNTINQSSGTLQMRVPGFLANYNLTNGELRGRDLTITNFTWIDGNLNNRAPGESIVGPADRTIIAPGGTLNYLGANDRFLSYYVFPARGLDNHGTWNWSGAGSLRGNGGVVNNYGTVNVTTNSQFNYGGSGGVSPAWNNFGTFTRSAGTGVFYFNNTTLNNQGGIYNSAGTLSLYNSTVTNQTGSTIALGAGTLLLSENANNLTLAPDSVLTHPDINGIQLISGSTFIGTTNISTPSLWFSGATVYQQTNIVVNTINQSGGTFDLRVPALLNNYNQTNGDVRGRDLTITNWNWIAGNHYNRAPSESGAGAADRTILAPGGTLNFSGATEKYLTYYAGPGRGLDLHGTMNWSSAASLRGQNGSTVNNHGTVNVSTNSQYNYGGAGSIAPLWNNFGAFNRTAGTNVFYFNNTTLNNPGVMDIQTGTLSIYNSTATNLPGGLIQMATGTLLLSENNNNLTLAPGSVLTHPDFNGIRLLSGSTFIGTTNITTPSLWFSGAAVYQQTNIVVNTINQSGGTFDLRLAAFLNNYNQTNGDVRGRDLTITNWTWIAGNHYNRAPSESGAGAADRTIVPVGGTLNYLGSTDRFQTYYAGLGRGIDNFGTWNWSGDGNLRSHGGVVNNHGTVNVTTNSQFNYGGSGGVAPTWNNFGTFARNGGTNSFYFNNTVLNNAGQMDIQTGILSLYNSTVTNKASGSLLVQPGAFLFNEASAVTTIEPGSTLGVASHNAFRLISGSLTLQSIAITAPSLWIQGGTLIHQTNNVIDEINQSGGVWRPSVAISATTYNFTNGEYRGADLSLNTFNWTGGALNSDGPGSNLVTVASALNISGATAKSMSYYTIPGRSLINNGNATWGGVNITGQGTAAFRNHGTLTVTNDVAFVYGNSGGASSFQNFGTYTKTNGTGTASFGGTVITNSGTMTVNSGSFNVSGAFVQTAGSTHLGTNFTASGGVRVEAGSFTGRGTVAGAFYNNGVVNPGASPGLISGATFTNSGIATVNFELGGTNAVTNFDAVRLTGAATLDGTLKVLLVDNFAPQLSNSFEVMRFASRNGTYASIVPPPGVELTPVYSTTNLVLNVTGLSNAPLEIVTAPTNVTVWEPDPATFAVVASGVTPITYQWQFNDVNIPGATNTTFTITNTVVTNAGTYKVIITDGLAATTNASATLTVIPFFGTIYWVNTNGGNWHAATNWAPPRVPSATNTAVIITNGTYTVTIDSPAAVSNLIVGASNVVGSPTLHLVSGSSLELGGNSVFETNSIFALNGLLRTAGGTNDIRGRINWQLGTLSGAGRTVITNTGSIRWIGSLNQKNIATNIIENFGVWTYASDSFGDAQAPRFSGGTQLTNHPSGVINIGAHNYTYAAGATEKSYFVNHGTINATSSSIWSPSSIGLEFLNYGLLHNFSYTYLYRGTNYGTFQWANTLCEISMFGDEGTGEYFSFEDGTTFVGVNPVLNIGGYAQWNTTAPHPGFVRVLGGSGGASFANPEFRILKNYTQTGQTVVNKGRWTFANPALTANLNSMSDGIINGFHSFVISNAGTIFINSLSHNIRNLANGGTIIVKSNLSLTGSSATYGGGTIVITNTAAATFAGGSVDAQRVDNYGTNSVTGGMAFTGGTFYYNRTAAQTYFGGGSFGTGTGAVLNEGLMQGYGGISSLSVTNRGTVLANDTLNRVLSLGSYVQESGATEVSLGRISGNLDITGGSLSGTNQITGWVRNGSSFHPGDPSGNLAITGTFTNLPGAFHYVTIGGTNAFPRVNVSGEANLAGSMVLSFGNGFVPQPGNMFTVLTYSARSGVFTSLNAAQLGLTESYTSNALVLLADNILPSATVVSPAPGNPLNCICEPYTFEVTASDPDNGVSNVVLYVNSVPLATLSNAPYRLTLTNDFVGELNFQARVRDLRGGETLSPPLYVRFIGRGGTNSLNPYRWPTNLIRFCMEGEPGRDYDVEAATNMVTPTWTVIGQLSPTNGKWELYVPDLTNFTRRYYRAVRLPREP